MTSIRVEEVSKAIRGREVLSQVSLVVHPGSVVGLAGVNGSGKTMLMRVMLGLVRPSSGVVSCDGQVLGRDIDFPPSVGALIEGPSFLDGVSGLRNLLELAGIRGLVGEDEVREAIRRVGLDPDDRRRYRAYSLGMRQRLGIAAAVMERPEAVFLDEPTNALDTQGVEMLVDLVRVERQRGAAVVVSCHDEGLLGELSDEVWRLSDGRVVGHEGTFGRGRHAYVEG